MLADGARRVGFAEVELVAEPVAAATYLAVTRGAALPPGSCVLIYDLGAGTCDVTSCAAGRTGSCRSARTDLRSFNKVVFSSDPSIS